MAKGKRTRRPIVLETTAIVPARRHGVIPMTPRPPRRSKRVSLCVIARDEAEELGGCIESAKAVVRRDRRRRLRAPSDETIDVARAHGANVIEAPWTEDFSAARNIALAQASGAWVLALDADERLSPEAADSLVAAVTDAGRPRCACPSRTSG
jgi:hypothetical protein